MTVDIGGGERLSQRRDDVVEGCLEDDKLIECVDRVC